MTIKKLKIEGMHCSSCAISIDFGLEDLSGIKQARTNFARQETEVIYDEEKVDIQLILEQIEKNGYKVSVKE